MGVLWQVPVLLIVLWQSQGTCETGAKTRLCNISQMMRRCNIKYMYMHAAGSGGTLQSNEPAQNREAQALGNYCMEAVLSSLCPAVDIKGVAGMQRDGVNGMNACYMCKKRGEGTGPTCLLDVHM
jgi:hypothetical protein